MKTDPMIIAPTYWLGKYYSDHLRETNKVEFTKIPVIITRAEQLRGIWLTEENHILIHGEMFDWPTWERSNDELMNMYKERLKFGSIKENKFLILDKCFQEAMFKLESKGFSVETKEIQDYVTHLLNKD